jgi:hypothetical protein
MPYCKTVILSLFFVLIFSWCNAQEGNKYVYQDSTVQSTDSTKIVEAPPSTDSSSQTIINNTVIPDTILRLNSLVISRDSIELLKNSKAFAYAKNLDSLLKALKMQQKTEVQQTSVDNRSDWLERLLASNATKIFLWSLAGLFIAFVLYKLFFIEGGITKRKVRSNVNELGKTEAGSHSYNYDKLINQAIQDKDYRMAIRYLYLQSLQRLSTNGLVQLEAEKTNYQYINELNNTVYKDDFLWLTLNYEYVWYGEFEVNEEVFGKLKNSFEQFNNRLQKS